MRKIEKCNNCLEDRAQLVKSDEEIKENVLKKVRMILEDFIDLGIKTQIQLILQFV